MSTKTTTGIFSGVAALLGWGPVARGRVFVGKRRVFEGGLRSSTLHFGITSITIRTRDTKHPTTRFPFVL